MNTPSRAEFRAHQWINTDTLQPIYSIQARIGKNGWVHVATDGKPLFFEQKADRDKKLKELSA